MFGKIGRAPEMPFAEERGLVTRLVQALGDGDFLQRQRAVRNRIEAKPLLVAAGNKPRAGRTALRGGNITGGATHPVLRQTINVGSLDITHLTLGR